MTHDPFVLLRGTRILRVMFTGGTRPCHPVLLDGGFEIVLIAADILYRTFAATGNRIALLIKLHPNVEAHTTKDVANFAQSLLAEILGSQHFALRALHQIANGFDPGVLQTIV